MNVLQQTPTEQQITQPAYAGDAPLPGEGTHHDPAAPLQVGHELSGDPGTVDAPEYVSRAVRAATAPNGSGSFDTAEADAEWDRLVDGLHDVYAAGDRIIANHTADALGSRSSQLSAERNRFMARTGRYLAQVALGGARRLATTRVAQNIAARRQNPSTYVTADVMHDYGVQRVAIDPVPMRQPRHRSG